MIRPALPLDLSPDERYGLEALIDLSRLVVVADPSADVVTLRVVDTPGLSLDARLQHGPGLEIRDGTVTIGRRLLGDITGIAGAAFEQQSGAADRHGRVPSAVNALVVRGREREPLVHLWATALRRAVQQAAGRRPVRSFAPWPEGRRWAAALTHDLDVVSGWPLFAALRIGELARQGEWRRARMVVSSALRAIGSAPVEQGVRLLLATERETGIRSTWFVLSGTPSFDTWRQGDLTYRLESPEARRLVELVGAGGHEIGLHGSFRTALDGARMHEERVRLGRLLDAPPAGVRQHFLRLRPGQTHALMEAAGFSYDATLGFADRNGFRTGAADVLPAWVGGARSKLDTVPLVWMDRALSKYRHVEDPDRWIDDGLELAAAARAVDGLWVGLWHPNLVAPLGFPDAPAALRRLIEQLATQHPWFATLEQVVQWRRARRSSRAVRVTADGGVEVVTDSPAPWPVRLEDGERAG